MRRPCLLGAVALGALSACGEPNMFPTGVFRMTFQETQSNCAFHLQTDPVTVTIDVDDAGAYQMIGFGGQIPAVSQAGARVTFLLSTTDAQVDTCVWDETDTFTLTGKGQNFAGTAVQTYTNGTCAACTIEQSVVGTKTGE